MSSARASSSCVTCHAGLEGDLAEPAKAWDPDVHRAAGLGCESCHGGDPSAVLKEDADAAMGAAKGFKAAPDRLAIAEFCGRCHADAAYMKTYNPKLRVDQLTEYRTSVHGKLNAKGDKTAATCIDCHGAHGIRPVSSPEAPVYASNVPVTCARCHADAARMAPYGIRTDQYELYRASVHGAALLERGDTAAPACNDCHGNHGAVPPGVQSVANVCGQCHGREASLFRASFKKDLFESLRVPECIVCHDHHRIRHPTPEMFHGASAPQVSAGKVVSASPFSADLGDLSGGQRAAAVWTVVLRPHLQAGKEERLVHRIEIRSEGAPALFLDATIGPGESGDRLERTRENGAVSAILTIEPRSGLPIQPGDSLLLKLEVRALSSGTRSLTVRDLPGPALISHAGSVCLQCHHPGDACDQASEKMYTALTSLDATLRDSAALLKRAEVAGMEVSEPIFDLKSKGTTAAVEARALIHSFDPERLLKRIAEGEAVGTSARKAGVAALAELQFRRKGLAVSLLLIGLVLLALFLKIRQVGRVGGRQEEAA